eukprot:CAMPEP_0178392478 /NCGR_PEP_ID=MMETSP0689_2-20121128/11699_1 /TAXON_ID=160604 /ORGANISM="Amphidinium massartii, Strain CS-259" /LENGTH=608 /DNA_ID=CAMNT_0020013053 /DNA_START=56 /DNA_END=1883 /DNA_ORIENTATION=+
MQPEMPRRVSSLLWLSALAWLRCSVAASTTTTSTYPYHPAEWCDGGSWLCNPGCFDNSSQTCLDLPSGNLSTATDAILSQECATLGGDYGNLCDCCCHTEVCQMGCYDDEDEACHEGLTEVQCAEIYAHVSWIQECGCSINATCRDGTSSSWTTSSDAGGEGGAVNIYFSVPAFVVLFRESLEVVILLAIMLQLLAKSKDDGTINEGQYYTFRREVYIGASLGFCACLVLGVGILVVVSFVYDTMEGDTLRAFDGTMMIVTCVILTFLAVSFYKMIYVRDVYELKLRRRIADSLESTRMAAEGKEAAFGKKHAFFVLAFTTGLREGLESIVFLAGVITDLDDLSSLPIPIISALILARLVGCCFFAGTKRMNVSNFMRASSILLLFIAAGFFSMSMHAWQELELFGTWGGKENRPWQNKAVFEATECCNDKTNRFFVLMRALFGWQDQPTPIEIFAYLVYWIIALTVGSFVISRAKKMVERKMANLAVEAEAAEKRTGVSFGTSNGNASKGDDATITAADVTTQAEPAHQAEPAAAELEKFRLLMIDVSCVLLQAGPSFFRLPASRPVIGSALEPLASDDATITAADVTTQVEPAHQAEPAVADAREV